MPMKLFALFILIFVAFKQKWFDLIPRSILYIFIALISWNILTIIRGSIYAKDYYDWKFLMDTSFFFLLIPLALVIGMYPLYIEKILSFTLRYLFLFGFILIPLAASDQFTTILKAYGSCGYSYSFISFVKPKWRILILIVAVISILSSIAFRTNIIRITVAILLMVVFYLQKYIKEIFIKFLHILFFSHLRFFFIWP